MEVHMSRLLRNSVILSALAVGIGALACRDTTTPRELATAGITGPSYTAAVDFTATVVGRGNLGTFHIQSKAGAYDVELKSHDNTDIVVANIAVAPGGHSGWHFHPGPVLVVVKTGTITFYMADDPTDHDSSGVAENASNGISVRTTTDETFLLPEGIAKHIDAPAPENCAYW